MRTMIFNTAAVLVMGIIVAGQTQRQPRSVTLDSGTRIDGQLQSTVDVQKAHVGDQVVLKTTNDIKQGGRTVVPKGSQLIGRVTRVEQRTKQNAVSRLGLVFERIKGQNLSAPINASIVNVTSAATHAAAGDTAADSDIFSSSSASTRSPGGTSSGGLLGGVTNTVGGVIDTTASTAGNITNTIGSTVGTTAGMAGRAVNGLQISNSTSASTQAGTTLSAADRNVRLEKGATVQLQLNSAARFE